MNQNASSPTIEAPELQIRLFGLRCDFKVFLAVILGLFSFLLLFGLGAALEGASLNGSSGKALGKYGEYGLAFVIGVYFLIAQYFLSRGNPQALRTVWPQIIAMNFILLCAPILCLILETKGAALGTLLLVILTVACSYAGAALAARSAHKRALAHPAL